MTAFCPQMVIFYPILAPLGGDVHTVCWADTSRKTCHFIFSYVWPSLRQMHRSEYKPRVKRRNAIIDESMEKWPMHLYGDGGLLLYDHTNEQNVYRLISTAGVPNNWNKVFETSLKTLLAWKSPPTWENYSRTLWVSWPVIPNPQNLCVHKHILAPGIFKNLLLENALCYQQKGTHRHRVLNLGPSTSSRAAIRER